MTFRTLTPSDFPQLHACFCEAFSDYQVAMKPTKADFRQRLMRIGYSPELSGGAFTETGELVGFIITGVASAQNPPTAYNGGTGVVASARRQGVAEKIYQYLFPIYAQNGLGHALLEVLTDNQQACALYQKLGFSVSRTLDCYQLHHELPKRTPSVPIRISQAELPDWQHYERFYSGWVCWQNNRASVTRSLSNEMVLEAYAQTELVGYLTFSPQSGKISQLAVESAYRRKQIGHTLVRAAQRLSRGGKLTLLNLDRQNALGAHFLQACGFSKSVSQYEMHKAIAPTTLG